MDIKAFKMDGLGNDFVIIDQRSQNYNLTKDQIIKICDRKFIGCDQLILIQKSDKKDAGVEFYNSDGSISGACGNGTRCVADLLSKENDDKEITLWTSSGELKSQILGSNLVETEIGIPKTNWNEIPLNKNLDTKNLNIKIINKNNIEHTGGTSVNVGNPHVVFFVDNIEDYDLKEIDDKTLDRIEEYLIQSDVGVVAASEIKEIISDSKIDPKKDIAEEISTILKEYIISLMKPLENNSFFQKKEKINATLVSGVNGVGKTTTIGKISKILKANGNKVMLAASDTFRAAAIEQLENWANKVEVDITKSSQGADPASVAYKAIEEAIANNFNQVLIDTAGRLQNKKNLMEEYKKIANVTKKIDPEAPHDVILILDATSGQNVINQVEEFNKIIPITGLIMTKLDGTAKGGILLAVAKKYKLPIIALGLGEKEDDLQIFEAEKFADAFTQIN